MRQGGMSRVRPHDLGGAGALLTVALVAGGSPRTSHPSSGSGRSPRCSGRGARLRRRLGDARGVRGGTAIAFATSAGFLVAYARRSTERCSLPPVSPDLDRAAAWSWRLLVSAAAVAAVLALLWYLRVIVLPVAVALTIAPAVSPIASWFAAAASSSARRRRSPS